MLFVLGMQASKILLLLDALAKKSLCSTTDRHLLAKGMLLIFKY